MSLEVRRAFEFIQLPQGEDAHVILLDRTWPRGLRKDELGLNEWARHLAPSTALRHWLEEDYSRWDSFLRHYRLELEPRADELSRLGELARETSLVLLYVSRERRHNAAMALACLLGYSMDSLAA